MLLQTQPGLPPLRVSDLVLRRLLLLLLPCELLVAAPLAPFRSLSLFPTQPLAPTFPAKLSNSTGLVYKSLVSVQDEDAEERDTLELLEDLSQY